MAGKGRKARKGENMRKSNYPLADTHRRFLTNNAKRIAARKRNSTISFKDLTDKLNTKYGTRYSVFQVSAYLGNMGYDRHGDIYN